MWLAACASMSLRVAACGTVWQPPKCVAFLSSTNQFCAWLMPNCVAFFAQRDGEIERERERERKTERERDVLNLTEAIFRRNFVSVECVANGKSWKPKAESLIASLMRLPALWPACLLLHANLIGFYFPISFFQAERFQIKIVCHISARGKVLD